MSNPFTVDNAPDYSGTSNVSVHENGAVLIGYGTINHVRSHGPNVPGQVDPKRLGSLSNQSDYVVDITYTPEGQDFQSTVYLVGDIKRDKTGGIRIVGVLGNIADLARAVGFPANQPYADAQTAQPTPAFLQFCIGKRIKVLRYANRIVEGKVRHTEWDVFSSPDTPDEEVLNRFLLGAARGYPSRYKPELVAQVGQSGTGQPGVAQGFGGAQMIQPGMPIAQPGQIVQSGQVVQPAQVVQPQQTVQPAPAVGAVQQGPVVQQAAVQQGPVVQPAQQPVAPVIPNGQVADPNQGQAQPNPNQGVPGSF